MPPRPAQQTQKRLQLPVVGPPNHPNWIAVFLLQQNLVIVIGRVIENDDAPFPCQFTYAAVAFEKLIRIEIQRSCPDKVRRRPIEVNECETSVTGNDGILPVHKKKLFVGKHVADLGENGRAKPV